MAFFDQLIAPLGNLALGFLEQFHMSPEDKAKAQQQVTDAIAAASKQAQDYEVQLNTIASQNIRADATNGDKYTERARPTFMYVIIAVLAFNYMGLPLAQVFGSKVGPIVLPADLLTLFGVCVTGYVFSRTAEKVSAMPGDSQANIFGMKIGNKS